MPRYSTIRYCSRVNAGSPTLNSEIPISFGWDLIMHTGRFVSARPRPNSYAHFFSMPSLGIANTYPYTIAWLTTQRYATPLKVAYYESGISAATLATHMRKVANILGK